MIALYSKQGRQTALAVIISILLTTASPAQAINKRQAGALAAGAATCLLFFASVIPKTLGPVHVTPPGEKPAAIKIENPASGQKLESVRDEMNKKITSSDLEKMKEEIRAEYSRGLVEEARLTKLSDSYAKTFIENILSNPKYRYIGLSIVAGELLIGGMLWARMRLNVKTFRRQLKTADAAETSLRPYFERWQKAEAELVLALRRRDGEDRAELMRQLETLPESNRRVLEAMLKPLDAAEAKAEIPSEDEAWDALQLAYASLQEAAAVEARVLSAAGPRTVPAPQTLKEIAAQVEGNLKNINGLDLTMDQIAKFKNEIKHLDSEAKAALGQDLKLRQKLWRKSRTGLLLITIPVVALAINQMFDNQEAAERREADFNVAALQDREKFVHSLIPNMHRPILWTVVNVWKDEPKLAQYQCPLTLKPYETDNPDLLVIQALVYRTILKLGIDPAKNPDFKFDEKFFEALFPQIFALNSGLAKREQEFLDKVNHDLSYQAVRIFDEITSRPPVKNPVFPVGPAFGGGPRR